MVKTFAVREITEVKARAVMEEELPPLIRKLIRNAHKQGAKGREAHAEHSFRGPLFDAAVQLRDEFEAYVQTCVGSEAWTVGFGYSVNFHAPGTVFIRLK